MAPLPVIAGVYRCTINWNTVQGVTPRNVLHIRHPSSDEQDVFDDILTATLSGTATNIYVALHSDYAAQSIDVLKLDGASATQTFAVTGAPFNTTGGSGDLVPEAACLVKLASATGGPRGRGRQFIGPLAEAAISAGFLAGFSLPAIDTAWDDFQGGLNGAGLAAVVVASYVHADAHDVTSFSTRPYVATQRRRLLQTRP